MSETGSGSGTGGRSYVSVPCLSPAGRLHCRKGKGKTGEYIRKKKEPSGVYFSLKNIAEASEVYSLREPLAQDYQIKDTVIYPAQETVADENGTFFILLQDLPQEKCLLYYSKDDEGKEKQGEIEIVQGKENYIIEED